jgi:hypothetical protein
MFRFRRKPSSGSHSQYLAKITHLVQRGYIDVVQTLSALWLHGMTCRACVATYFWQGSDYFVPNSGSSHNFCSWVFCFIVTRNTVFWCCDVGNWGLQTDKPFSLRNCTGMGLCDDALRDESWFFQYDPESKRQPMHWKSPSSPRQKKARQSKSRFKAMMIFFSTSEGLFTWIGCSDR